MMIKYVFVGAEAEGNYSNSYVCEGVFLTEEYFDKHKDEVEGSFAGRTFYELDGKHSEVDGDLIVKKFGSVTEIVEFTADSDVCYETYHLTEHFDGEDEDFEDYDKRITEMYAEIEALIRDYKTYTYALTPEQNVKVEAYIKELTEEDK